MPRFAFLRLKQLSLPLAVSAAMVVSAVRTQGLSILSGRAHGPQALARKGRRPIADTISRSLAWLAARQGKDGSFGTGTRALEATSLATLAFVANGNTPSRGPHRRPVARAIEYLTMCMRKDGFLVGQGQKLRIRDHAIATQALVELQVLGAFDDDKDLARRAVRALIREQNTDGGWGLRPGRKSSLGLADWVVPSIWLARRHGIVVDDDCWQSSVEYLAAYLDADERSPSRVDATLAAIFTGYRADSDVLQERKAALFRAELKWRDSHVDIEQWMLSMHASYQLGGEIWKKWRSACVDTLLSARIKSESTVHWNPRSVGGRPKDPIQATALATLALQTYYRYTRLTR